MNQDGHHQTEGLTEKQQELENLCTEQAAKIERLTRLVNKLSVSLCLLKIGSAHMVTVISYSGGATQTSNCE